LASGTRASSGSAPPYFTRATPVFEKLGYFDPKFLKSCYIFVQFLEKEDLEKATFVKDQTETTKAWL
jgi:hypothetical protein